MMTNDGCMCVVCVCTCVDMLVQYPLNGLDLTPYMEPGSVGDVPPLYDLWPSAYVPITTVLTSLCLLTLFLLR